MPQGRAITLHGTHSRKDASTFPVEIKLAKFEAGDRRLFLASARDLSETQGLEHSRGRVIGISEMLRKEIAYRLHSSVQTKLIVALHHANSLKSAAPKGSPTQADDLNHILKELIDVEIPSITGRLYPSILRRGLIPALQSLVDQVSPILNVNIELNDPIARAEAADPTAIPEEVRLAAYRVAESAISNVAEHAAATKVSLAIETKSDGLLTLTVADNGRGFDPTRVERGIGLDSMRDYCENVGGTYQAWISQIDPSGDWRSCDYYEYSDY